MIVHTKGDADRVAKPQPVLDRSAGGTVCAGAPLAPVMAAVSGVSTSVIVLIGTALAFGGAVAAGFLAVRTVDRMPARRTRSGRSTGHGMLAPESIDLVVEPRSVHVLEVLLLVVLAGYVFFDRAFAWIHIPGTPLFVGELVIGVGVLVLLGMHTHIGAVGGTSSSMKALAVFMAWGVVLLILALPSWGEDAVRDAAVWYYGIIAVFVVAMLVSEPRRIGSWLRIFGKLIPWMLIWLPFAIVLDAMFVDQVARIPDSRVSILSHRTGNIAVMAAIALGYLWLVDTDGEVFDRRQRNILTALATVIILFAAMRNRGGFVAGGVALFLAFLFLRRERANMAAIMVGVAVLLLAIGLFGNLRLQLFGEREVSIDQFLDNLVSVVDRSAGGRRQESTTKWRLEIWGRVFDDVTQDYPVAGFGPGPDLGKRYDITGDGDLPLRNPHNSHVGVLARTGLVGVMLWAFLWISWYVELIRLRRRLTAQARHREAAVAGWLMVSVVAILVNAIFDPTLEGPQVAWWLWGFVGFGIGMVALERWRRLPEVSLVSEPPTDRRPAVTVR